MLAVVKTPHTEISIHGDGSARILEYLKQQFQIEVLAADDDETLVNIRDSEYWKTEVTPGTLLTGFRLKHGLTQNELAEKSGVNIRQIQRYESGTSGCENMTLKNAIARSYTYSVAIQAGLKAES